MRDGRRRVIARSLESATPCALVQSRADARPAEDGRLSLWTASLAA
jgi:hypothetical protein